MLKWARTLALLACLLLLPRVAAAQRVLLARPPASDATLFEAYGRLRAELELQAFEVVVLEGRETQAIAEELEREAQARGAFAALALQRDTSGTAARIYIVDRVTGKTTSRKLRIDPSSDGPTLLAVRAVDLLRASLVELAPGQRPTRDVLGVDAAPPPPEVVRFSRESPRFQVRTGGLALLTPALGTGVGVLLGASYRPFESLDVGIELAGPLFGAEYDAAGGAASVRQEFALLRASLNLSTATSERRWEYGPLIGAGAYHLEATGVVEPPFVARTEQLWSFAANAGLRARYFFDRTVSLGFDVSALALLPRPVIAVDQERSSSIALQGLGAVSLGASF